MSRAYLPKRNHKKAQDATRKMQRAINRHVSFDSETEDIEKRICHCCRKQAKNLWGVNDAVGDVVWVCDICYKEMIDCMEW